MLPIALKRAAGVALVRFGYHTPRDMRYKNPRCSHRLFPLEELIIPSLCGIYNMMTTSTTTTDPSPKPWRVAFLAEHDVFRCSPKFPSLSTSPPSAAAPPPLPSTITTTAAAAAAATSTAPRRLSSGSACETCRRRKTKCDGGQPCAYCASNRIECLHRPSKKRSTHQLYKVSEFRSRGIMKQASCPSFLAARRASSSSPSSSAMIGNATDRPVTKEEIPSMMGKWWYT